MLTNVDGSPSSSLRDRIDPLVISFFLCIYLCSCFVYLCNGDVVFFLFFSSKAVSPYYVGLNPGPDHLAFALRHLLLANDWLPITLIVDDSLRAQKIKRVVQQVGANPADQLVNKVNLFFSNSLFLN